MNKFLVKLGSVPYFTNMSISPREIWLDINEADNENSIGQEGAKLQLVQPGESLLIEKLSEKITLFHDIFYIPYQNLLLKV